MRTEVEIRERLEQHEEMLKKWVKPTGAMLRQAPTAEERRCAAHQHEISAWILRWVLKESHIWPYPHPYTPWRDKPYCAMCGRPQPDALHMDGEDAG